MITSKELQAALLADYDMQQLSQLEHEMTMLYYQKLGSVLSRLQLCKKRYAYKRLFSLDKEGLWQSHK